MRKEIADKVSIGLRIHIEVALILGDPEELFLLRWFFVEAEVFRSMIAQLDLAARVY